MPFKHGWACAPGLTTGQHWSQEWMLRPAPCVSSRQRRGPGPQRSCRARAQDPTTSALSAAMLVYALGAGITAAAGTRLALQLILSGGFGYHNIALWTHIGGRTRYYSFSLPRRICLLAMGKLRACCHPWTWSPFLMRPLRNRTTILRYPSVPQSATALPSG